MGYFRFQKRVSIIPGVRETSPRPACPCRGSLPLHLSELKAPRTGSHDEAIARKLQVMDTAAFALARDNGIPIVVFSVDEPGAIPSALLGKRRATYVNALTNRALELQAYRSGSPALRESAEGRVANFSRLERKTRWE